MAISSFQQDEFSPALKTKPNAMRRVMKGICWKKLIPAAKQEQARKRFGVLKSFCSA